MNLRERLIGARWFGGWLRSAPTREILLVRWQHADRILRNGDGWRISERNDTAPVFGYVWIERIDPAPPQ